MESTPQASVAPGVWAASRFLSTGPVLYFTLLYCIVLLGLAPFLLVFLQRAGIPFKLLALLHFHN